MAVHIDDDGSGSEAAPDEGLLAGGFIHRVGGAYELDWVGTSQVAKWYTTVMPNDDLVYAADVQRGPVGETASVGLRYLTDGGGVEFMQLFLKQVDGANVSIEFNRTDSGGAKDAAQLAASIALAYEGWIRLGVRIIGGVQTAFRADPLTGLNEVSLGVLTTSESPVWPGDATHNLFGVGTPTGGQQTGVAWDNLYLADEGGGGGGGSPVTDVTDVAGITTIT